MRETSENTQWKKIPKILFRSWPLGLGAVLAFPGGIMTYWMILALDPNEHWALTLCTVLLILGVVLVVLFFPYKIRIEKNGDYEIRTLLLKMHRKTKPNELEESDLDFGMDDHHVADVEVV